MAMHCCLLTGTAECTAGASWIFSQAPKETSGSLRTVFLYLACFFTDLSNLLLGSQDIVTPIKRLLTVLPSVDHPLHNRKEQKGQYLSL
jgi:hypothetical protein